MSDTTRLQSVLAKLATTRESQQAKVDQGNQTMADAQAAYSMGQALVNAHAPMVEAYQAAMDLVAAELAAAQADEAAPPVVEAPAEPTVAPTAEDASAADPEPTPEPAAEPIVPPVDVPNGAAASAEH